MSDLLTKMPLTYEPLRKNRWILRFPADLGIQEWTLESAKRPQINQPATEIQFINTSTYVVGRYTWGEINVVFRDPIGPSTSQAIMEWVRLTSLDPTGAVVQKWILKNCFLTDVDFGDLAYSDDGLATISATIRPDYCILAY